MLHVVVHALMFAYHEYSLYLSYFPLLSFPPISLSLSPPTPSFSSMRDITLISVEVLVTTIILFINLLCSSSMKLKIKICTYSNQTLAMKCTCHPRARKRLPLASYTTYMTFVCVIIHNIYKQIQYSISQQIHTRDVQTKLGTYDYVIAIQQLLTSIAIPLHTV